MMDQKRIKKDIPSLWYSFSVSPCACASPPTDVSVGGSFLYGFDRRPHQFSTFNSSRWIEQLVGEWAGSDGGLY